MKYFISLILCIFSLSTFAEVQSHALPNKLDGYAQGSGFFINTKGYIATAAHVVEDVDQVMVLYKNALRKANIVAVDLVKDLAIIKLEEDVGITPFFPISKSPDPHQTMYVIGFPAIAEFGLYPHITSGQIIKLHMLIAPHKFEMNTLACHGNSGGVVTNYEGSAVGMLVLGFGGDGTCSTDTGANYLDGLIDLATFHHIMVYTSTNFSRMPEQAALYQNIQDIVGQEKVVFIQVHIKD